MSGTILSCCSLVMMSALDQCGSTEIIFVDVCERVMMREVCLRIYLGRSGWWSCRAVRVDKPAGLHHARKKLNLEDRAESVVNAVEFGM